MLLSTCWMRLKKLYFNWINIVVIKRSSPSMFKHSTGLSTFLIWSVCVCVCVWRLEIVSLSYKAKSFPSSLKALVQMSWSQLQGSAREMRTSNHTGICSDRWPETVIGRCSELCSIGRMHGEIKPRRISSIQVQISSPPASLKQITLIFNLQSPKRISLILMHILCNLMKQKTKQN